ncbi:MAG TPA: type IIL restriction-modification enzyme MmeI, partial [Candidatus Paceibacterota bacterium]
YLPIGFCTPDIIASGTALIVPSATLYHLGILTSIMHMAWMRAVCGRLESRYQYSASIVYNNFPWPKEVSDEQKKKIEAYTQTVLDARAKFPDASLADLYDPLTMPPELSKAHQELDHDVDKAYGRTDFKTEADRIAFLFEQYQKLTAIKNA